ncbi:hypothetical protein CXB51_002688 [Gossypium anomalum]|uniref:Uncharacterized protein n=1 Tax=Gossypium anomalum TaxID=47600 RepID=A0A8J6D6P6_9ROSI|nr:hypothetical protein CXB51_002688 [Gossypium anomalum]
MKPHTLVEAHYELNLRELYERDERFAELINLLYVTRDKKIATISSMYAPMDKDVLSSFPLRYFLNVCSNG